VITQRKTKNAKVHDAPERKWRCLSCASGRPRPAAFCPRPVHDYESRRRKQRLAEPLLPEVSRGIELARGQGVRTRRARHTLWGLGQQEEALVLKVIERTACSPTRGPSLVNAVRGPDCEPAIVCRAGVTRGGVKAAGVDSCSRSGRPPGARRLSCAASPEGRHVPEAARLHWSPASNGGVSRTPRQGLAAGRAETSDSSWGWRVGPADQLLAHARRVSDVPREML